MLPNSANYKRPLWKHTGLSLCKAKRSGRECVSAMSLHDLTDRPTTERRPKQRRIIRWGMKPPGNEDDYRNKRAAEDWVMAAHRKWCRVTHPIKKNKTKKKRTWSLSFSSWCLLSISFSCAYRRLVTSLSLTVSSWLSSTWGGPTGRKRHALLRLIWQATSRGARLDLTNR